MTLSARAIYGNPEEDEEFQRSFEQTREKMFPPVIVEEVFSVYEIERSQYLPVLLFLVRNHGLVGLLLDAMPHIRRVFGEVEVSLEVKVDPDEEFEVLFGIIRVDHKPAESLRLLKEFDESWFLGVLDKTNNLLNFTLDFKANEPV